MVPFKPTNQKTMHIDDINEADKKLIAQLREKIKEDLKLVPSYDDDFSLLRWIVGWDRKIDVVVPKIRFSLRAIHALGLDNEDFSSIDKITKYCDNVSQALQYLPGSVVGFDRDGNVLVIQMIGRCDAAGLVPCTRNSDLYVMRIAESEGVMHIIRECEKRSGRQYGTSVIFDLEGIHMGMIDTFAIKVVNAMLSQLQEMFPDVLRKVFIINAPSFIQILWQLVSPCLAKQTQQKIQFLGADWKDKLRESIGAENLYRHWGGDKEHESEYGDVRMGGKVPPEMRYDPANDLPEEKLKKFSISARSTNFIPVPVYGERNPKRRLRWWWRLESGDVHFSVNYSTCKQGDVTADHPDDVVMRPKFKLQTEYVPEDGEIVAAEPGVYKLIFDNTHGKLWSKNVRYWVEVAEE